MKEAEKESLPLVNVHATIADYQREGQSTKNHRASLLERFDIMSRHYGLFTTIIMHFGLSYVLYLNRKARKTKRPFCRLT